MEKIPRAGSDLRLNDPRAREAAALPRIGGSGRNDSRDDLSVLAKFQHRTQKLQAMSKASQDAASSSSHLQSEHLNDPAAHKHRRQDY